ncbi:MAG TPA: alpha/beta hydrolase [Myxococcota bacterium]|nr:alpha/beta hydrolase [Myxococcota bacterium]
MGPIAVRRWGSDGPQVALLHGGPGAAGDLADLARALAPRFQVLEPLQRRSGETALTVARHVADLAEVLPGPMHVVGHSWGAMLGLSFAAAHPGLVTSLCLVGCGTYDAATRAVYARRSQSRMTAAQRAELAELQGGLASARDRTARDALSWRAGQLFSAVYGVDLLPREPGDEPLWVDSGGEAETWPDVLRLQAEGVEPAAFSAIRAPVRMLHGDDDPHPGPMIRDLLARHVADLSYLGFPRCGHDPWRERHAREPFLRALEEWLRRGSSRREDGTPLGVF